MGDLCLPHNLGASTSGCVEKEDTKAGTKQVICRDRVRRDGSSQTWGFVAVASAVISKGPGPLACYSGSGSVLSSLGHCETPLPSSISPSKSIHCAKQQHAIILWGLFLPNVLTQWDFSEH